MPAMPLTGGAIFYGGPLDGQLHAMSNPLSTFYYAAALPTDWMVLQEEADPTAFPEVDKYTYERQFYFSSEGHLVYLCID